MTPTARAGWPVGSIAAGVVAVSFNPIVVRLAEVEATRSAFLRGAYSVPVLLAAVLWARRRHTAGFFDRGAFAAGAVFGISIVTLHLSISMVGAGIAALLGNLHILVVPLLAASVGARLRVPRAYWIAVPVVLLGVALLSLWPAQSAGLDPGPLGVLLGFASAVAAGIFIVAFREARVGGRGSHESVLLLSAMVGMTAVAAVAAVASSTAAPAGRWPEDGWVLLLALGPNLVGFTLLLRGVHRVPAAVTSVALMAQPVLSLVLARIVLDETMSAVQAVGAVVVLLGMAMATKALMDRSPSDQGQS